VEYHWKVPIFREGHGKRATQEKSRNPSVRIPACMPEIAPAFADFRMVCSAVIIAA
jgi:hypothetical protein